MCKLNEKKAWTHFPKHLYIENDRRCCSASFHVLVWYMHILATLIILKYNMLSTQLGDEILSSGAQVPEVGVFIALCTSLYTYTRVSLIRWDV